MITGIARLRPRAVVATTPTVGAFASALIVSVSAQAPFTFAGVGLKSTIESAIAAYPHSQRVGDLLYVAPEDRRDHIGTIGFPGREGPKRLRITFEVAERGRGPTYPPCDALHQQLVQTYGPPAATREFDEERSRRSDRVWESATEQMTLVCFRAPGRDTANLLAEAIVIAPR